VVDGYPCPCRSPSPTTPTCSTCPVNRTPEASTVPRPVHACAPGASIPGINSLGSAPWAAQVAGACLGEWRPRDEADLGAALANRLRHACTVRNRSRLQLHATRPAQPLYSHLDPRLCGTSRSTIYHITNRKKSAPPVGPSTCNLLTL